jgi:crotonobetainyl-CoA:carnitine CoA-transferase CaiB-like acyl-CoA transferase
MQNDLTKTNRSALAGLRVLDLSRILAGPTATQMLADFGAEVIKIERPGSGDDTRGWGPPFLKDYAGAGTRESAYYLSANRGKQSVVVDISTPEGQEIIRELARQSDVLVENFKVGDLERYGLDYSALAPLNPRLIYCSISGFGQTGPNAHRAGYDFLAQGEGGLMSLTGFPDGPPLKAGVGIIDFVCGLYACTGILAAVQARHATGRGQHIDLGLIDVQIAALINQGVGYLTDGVVPPRRGNDHPTIVPYGCFRSADGMIILTIGNDTQFARFVNEAGEPGLSKDPRFASNAARVENRIELIPLIEKLTAQRTSAEWMATLERIGVPGGPVNDLSQVFSSQQVAARDMIWNVPHKEAATGVVSLIGNPLKMSETPPTCHRAPPALGQDTRSVLGRLMNLRDDVLDQLAAKGTIGGPR